MKIIGWALFHDDEFCIGTSENFSDVAKYVSEQLPYLKPIDSDKSIYQNTKNINDKLWTIRYLNGDEQLNSILMIQVI